MQGRQHYRVTKAACVVRRAGGLEAGFCVHWEGGEAQNFGQKLPSLRTAQNQHDFPQHNKLLGQQYFPSQLALASGSRCITAGNRNVPPHVECISQRRLEPDLPKGLTRLNVVRPIRILRTCIMALPPVLPFLCTAIRIAELHACHLRVPFYLPRLR